MLKGYWTLGSFVFFFVSLLNQIGAADAKKGGFLSSIRKQLIRAFNPTAAASVAPEPATSINAAAWELLKFSSHVDQAHYSFPHWEPDPVFGRVLALLDRRYSKADQQNELLCSVFDALRNASVDFFQSFNAPIHLDGFD